MEKKHEKNRNFRISFALRMIQNQTREAVRKSIPKFDKAPQSQLQGGILGYLYDHRQEPVYQKDIEKEFKISSATVTNTLQAMEKNGLIVRKSVDRDARLKRILMTSDAEANHAIVKEHMQMMDERMLEGMSEEDMVELSRYLQVIMNNLEKLNEQFEDPKSGRHKRSTGTNDDGDMTQERSEGKQDRLGRNGRSPGHLKEKKGNKEE